MLPEIHEGMTEKELAIRFDYLQLELGAQGNSFSTICASGENGSLPHAIPGNRKLRKGDMITLDVGCKVGGYCSDMTRTVALGEPSAEMRKVYNTVLEAQRWAVKPWPPERAAMRLTSWCGITSTAKAMWAALAMAWATGWALTSMKIPVCP